MLSALLSQQPVYQVRHLERLPLGTPYPAIIAHVGRLISRVPGARLAIDFTGVGRPVFDMFHFSGISPIGVLITGGTVPSQDGNILSVPKLSLVSRLQALLHLGQLRIHKDIPDAPVLVRELQDFRVEFSAAGNLTFNARTGKHDDLVLALAIACWIAYGEMANQGIVDFYRKKAVERSGLPVLDREVIGVDLGQSRDPTAIAVVKRVQPMPGVAPPGPDCVTVSADEVKYAPRSVVTQSEISADGSPRFR